MFKVIVAQFRMSSQAIAYGIGQVQWSLHGELVPLPNLASYSALSAVGFATALGYASTSAKGFYLTIQTEVWCTWVSCDRNRMKRDVLDVV